MFRSVQNKIHLFFQVISTCMYINSHHLRIGWNVVCRFSVRSWTTMPNFILFGQVPPEISDNENCWSKAIFSHHDTLQRPWQYHNWNIFRLIRAGELKIYILIDFGMANLKITLRIWRNATFESYSWIVFPYLSNARIYISRC